jgi:hypothetical protein
MRRSSTLRAQELHSKLVSYFGLFNLNDHDGWIRYSYDDSSRKIEFHKYVYLTGSDTAKGAAEVGLKLLKWAVIGGMPKGPSKAGQTRLIVNVRVTESPTYLHFESERLDHADVLNLWNILVQMC